MRIAIISDIHGNRTALEAVIADLRVMAPDLVLQGGDLADGGANPAWIVDCIRDLGWQGVAGNTDEMLWRPEALPDFGKLSAVIEERADATREKLGEERLAWLKALPLKYADDRLALVHASPESLWRAPAPEASDGELRTVYGCLQRPLAVYGHVHRPFARNVGELTVVNSGSAGLPYDGDRRAAYLLLDDYNPTVRRVEYDVDREVKALLDSAAPHGEWIARMLETAQPCMP